MKLLYDVHSQQRPDVLLHDLIYKQRNTKIRSVKKNHRFTLNVGDYTKAFSKDDKIQARWVAGNHII